MSDNLYPAGIRIFPPHENAPDFVKGTIIITPREFVDFCKENADLLTDYNGAKQLKCQLLDGEKGLYVKVDTYKKPEPQEKKTAQDVQAETEDSEDDLPF